MVSIYTAVAIGVAALSGAVNGLKVDDYHYTGTVSKLGVGEYMRPESDEVSGFVNVEAPFVRSPCPGLNTLANHGYIPRDGKNLTAAVLKEAVMAVYNIGEDLATALVAPVQAGISLSDLSKHNFIEHSASLAHADFDSDLDPSALDEERWESLAARAVDGQLGVTELAAARNEVEALCKARDDGCDLGEQLRMVAFSECSLILRAMGGKNEESISIDFLTSFFVEERLPEYYAPPPTPVMLLDSRTTAAKVLAMTQELLTDSE